MINTDEYRRIHSLRTNEESCSLEMEDHECLYELRKMEAYDLAIENVAQNGCTICYSVNKGFGFFKGVKITTSLIKPFEDLWLVPMDQLLEQITRSDGSMEDCEPKAGYHRSLENEIFRCETGSNPKGVLAFTEANGDTDYSCGFDEGYRPESWGTGLRSYDPVYKVNKYFLSSI